jgi:hypothetical protein
LLHEQFREHINSFNAYGDLKLDGGPPDFRMTAILKSLFVLTEWADGQAIERLEQKYQLHHGQIIGLAETAAWLLSAIGRLIYALNADSELPAQIDNYAFKVQFGIEAEMKEVHYLFGDILSRPDYQKLRVEGLQTIDSLRAIDERKLAGIIRPREKLERLLNEMKYLDKEAKMRKDSRNHAVDIYHGRTENAGGRGFETCPSLVEIDGHYEKERYLVKIDGFPVRLTGKSFMYLAKLAFSRLANTEGWIYKDDIEVGFNQARYLYRLRQEFKTAGCS